MESAAKRLDEWIIKSAWVDEAKDPERVIAIAQLWADALAERPDDWYHFSVCDIFFDKDDFSPAAAFYHFTPEVRARLAEVLETVATYDRDESLELTARADRLRRGKP